MEEHGPQTIDETHYREWAKRYTVAEIEGELVRCREGIAELEERGDEAVSKWDLQMGYDHAFCLQMKRNHLVYYERLLAAHPKALQPSLF
ncbi:MAG TPA: hypothetical protein PLB89_05175 [Flavobacteriales bacterium]|nr:hypothetical protein [Flavobacteriales bacterium]